MPDNILIIKPSSLGDVVHSLPVLAKLRSTYPTARISWLVSAAAAALVESNKALDRVFYFRRRSGDPIRTLRASVRLARELSMEHFDCAIDLQGLLRSALFARATKAPLRIGLSDAREGARHFYTERVRSNGAVHAVDRYLSVGAVLGFDASDPIFELDVPDAARTSVARFLAGGREPPERPYFVFSPGARWHTKVWPPENFASAGRLLLERFGGTVFLVGTRREAGAAAAVIAESIGPRAVDLTGRTSLEEVIALLAVADMLVSPDTGLMHIADALGLPLLAVFGATDPARTGPYLQRSHVVRSKGCADAPCMRRRCPVKYCRAMSAVSGEAVFERAADILETNA